MKESNKVKIKYFIYGVIFGEWLMVMINELIR